MRFKDKSVLITGASGGIGRELIPAFLNEGAKVCGVYKSNRQSLAPQFYQRIQADLTVPEEAERVVQRCVEDNGKIDILINGAAVTSDNFISNMPLDQWQEVINVNLNSVFNICKYALSNMNQNGHIINIGSIVAEIGAVGCSNYVAAKAGISGFTKALAKESLRAEIFVNELELGYFNVGLGARLPEKLAVKIAETIPLKRFGNPDDIIKAVFFLAETEYMTGGTLSLAGGL